MPMYVSAQIYIYTYIGICVCMGDDLHVSMVLSAVVLQDLAYAYVWKPRSELYLYEHVSRHFASPLAVVYASARICVFHL